MKHILFVAFSLLFVQLGQTQSFWKVNQDFSEQSETPIEIVKNVKQGNQFLVSYNELVEKLKSAPSEFKSKKSPLELTIPMPDGSLHAFHVYESSIMQDKLAAKYPSIKSYKIYDPVDKTINGRIGVGHFGFHGSIRMPEGTVYIDRYSDESKNHYVSYYTKDYQADYNSLSLECGMESLSESDEIIKNVGSDSDSGSKIVTRSPEGDVSLRTYRLAVSCTGEWGSKQGGTVESALAQVNIALNKINGVFENEVAIRMILINDNDKILFLDKDTDPFVNANEGHSLINQNTFQISKYVGYDSYDIGHIFTAGCSDVGGVAALGCVCGPNKGNGVTCHYSSNIEVMAVRVTCHEMGHQFSANHTFNNCNGNESAYGFEPGSGSTIMSYGGLCGAELNVIDLAYDYFHSHNLNEMIQFSRQGNGNECADIIETDNVNPVVSLDYTDGFYIPISTPFRLDGQVIDENAEDELTFSWEELDSGPSSIPGFPIGDAPQFISEKPNTTSERIFPALTSIITNINDKREVLPFYDKDMTFRLTARDNNIEGGGADWKEVQFFATEDAGPFKVSYPSADENLVAGTKELIQWDVANTDGALVNCQYVDVLLSADGGYTYPYLMASYTPNDGEELLVIPNHVTSKARIMIRASQSIFFDISNINSDILEATEPGYHAVSSPGYQEICLPSNSVINISTESFLDFEEPIHFEILGGLPEGSTAEFSKNDVLPGEQVTLTITGENVFISGVYDILIQAIAGLDTLNLINSIEFTSSDYSDLAVVNPAPGSSAVKQVPSFEWVSDTDAESYIFELSDNPNFVDGEINIQEQLTTNSYTIPVSLYKNTVYFWRITGVNKCGNGYTTAISTFATEALSCRDYTYKEVPVYISPQSTPTVQMKTELVSAGKVSDVNIKLFKGGHDNFKNLTGKLISPAGTEVILFSNQCANSTLFNGGFDDESPLEIACPMKNGIQYKPMGNLSDFIGEDIVGGWIFEIKDNVVGGGGQVLEYVLDVCSNASLNPPILVRNVELEAIPGSNKLLNQGRLKVEDSDSDDDELVYTLVEIPLRGTLQLSGSDLFVGDKFTQKDLNDNKIYYKHNGTNNEPDSDSFTFVVDDGEGGWIDLNTFNVNIDIANNIQIDEFDYEVSIYPNPAGNYFNIIVDDAESQITYAMYDVFGRQVISNQVLSKGQSISTAELTSGNYFIKIFIDGKSTVKKLVIQK